MPAPSPTRKTQRGQVVVLFAVAIVLFVGICAIVLDVSSYWVKSLQAQRAADAGALAGATYLPGNVVSGQAAARAAAAQNGFVDGTGTTRVEPVQDPTNAQRMRVTVEADTPTFFMRVFGIVTVHVSRTARAEYILPVPMGSPANYYGVSCLGQAGDAGCTNPLHRVPDALGGGAYLASQGFWGAAITKGGQHENGDAYNTFNNGSSANSDYDPSGYAYTVVIPTGGGGRVWVFDPTFCATGGNGAGGYYGTGDHWIGTSRTPVSTYFNLYDTNGTPYYLADDTLIISSGGLFASQIQSDRSGPFAGSGAVTGITDCRADPYHNQWWQLASGLPAGTYRLQVTTTAVVTATSGGTIVANAAINANTNAENMFSLEVAATYAGARVYGSGRMAAYNNLSAGTQLFYLAQIGAQNAGKTMEIDLFDPGDVSGGAWLRILSPNGNVYSPISFTYTANNGRSGSGTCIQANGGSGSVSSPAGCPNASSGGSFFNNAWITILVPLPVDYGSTGLTPSGEPGAGWWKIEYTVNGGNDTTTWRVGIRGNPDHLILP